MLTLFALAACGGGGYGGGSYGGGGGGGGGSGIITNIVISPGASSLSPGKTQQFMATSKDSGGNTVSGASLTWTSSNTSVATVNSSGLATAKADGSTTITASITYSSGGGMYGGGAPVTYTSNMATLSVAGASMVMGTAAVGHALAGAVVTLEDARGQTQTAMSDTEGRFLLATAGMQAPYLLKAVDNQGRTLFGMRADDGVANVTPVTDLMVRAWFAAQGSDAAAAFADPAHHPAPDAASLAQLDGRFTQALRGDLLAAGLDPTQFSFISTPFDADGTGADHILDNLGVDTGQGRLLLQDRMGGQPVDASMLMREGTDSKQASI